MLRDFRFALRSLRHSPLFTTIALVSLALGIGANTAIFTIADQVLFRPLPVANAAQLVSFSSPGPQSGTLWGLDRFSYPMYRDLMIRDLGSHNPAFTGIAGRFPTPLNLSYNNRSERIRAELVTGAYFQTLGLTTTLGRGITPEDDRLPADRPIAVLTYDYWRRRFNGNPAILNQTVLLNGYPITIVGIAARDYRGFDIAERTDILVPTMMKNQMTPTWQGLDNRRVQWLQLIGALRPGVTPQQARAALEPIYHGLLIMEMQTMRFRSEETRARFASKPLLFEAAARGISDIRQSFSDPLRILLAIVALLLLIACANVANLLLARAVARQREIAVRIAVGASRGALIRQLLTESLILSVIGSGIGVLISWWIAAALLSGSPDLPLDPAPEPRILAFTFCLSLLTGLVFGLAPAWQATSPQLAATLKDLAGSVSAHRGNVRLRKALVVSQVALSLLMLIASALFTRSLRNVQAIDLGFIPDRLLTFTLDPSLAGYNPARMRQLTETLQTRLAGLPGARSAAIGQMQIVTGDQNMSSISIQGYQPRPDEDMTPWVDWVTPGYFQTMGTPLLAGRDFTPRDRLGTPRVAVVNETFARTYFPNQSPLGRHFAFGSRKNDEIEIVGVVRPSKYSRVDEPAHAVAYVCYAQDENPSAFVAYVRTAGDPRTLFAAIRREVTALDPALPISALRTMSDQVDESLAARRAMSYLSALFAILATVLAAIGLYGLMAYTVARRTREIGIRVALGAGRGSLLNLVMREVALLTAIGVGVAIPLSLVLTRFVRAQLYGIVPNDPASIGLASLLLVCVALLAGYIPAEKATRVDPIRALRYE
jgi:predicted permease